MKYTEGIIWEKKAGEWVKTLDNWPYNRRGARIIASGSVPFGNYSKSEAIEKIEDWITRGPIRPDCCLLGIIPGKEMAPEDKEKLKQYNTKRKEERGEIEPVESYISKEE
jgi:hypothetical protein